MWAGGERQLLRFGDGDLGGLDGTDGQGDFAGGGTLEPGEDAPFGATVVSARETELLVLRGLSGGLADEALAHGVATRRHGDVSVAGPSSPALGAEPRATVWPCAYAQGVPIAGAASERRRAARRGSGTPAPRPRGSARGDGGARFGG